MSVEIRPARLDEATRVIGLYEWLFTPPGEPPPRWDPVRAEARLVEAIAAEGSNVLVADDGGELIGFATTYLDLDSVRYGLRCWVEDLAVDPGRRSEGVGKGLLDMAKEWAAERGATHLELDSGETRTDAHRFYEREGPAWRGKQYSWVLPGRGPRS